MALALLLAVYGGTQGASALITALNVAYEEREKRGFFKLYLVAFAITGAAVVLALGAAASTTATAFLDGLMPGAPDVVLTAIRLASYVLLGLMAVTAAGLLYRFGPDRSHARWIWLTPGSLIATILWLAVTNAFAFYAANLGHYSATYGSLGAVIVLQFWLWLSAYVFLLGAELIRSWSGGPRRTRPPGPPPRRANVVRRWRMRSAATCPRPRSGRRCARKPGRRGNLDRPAEFGHAGTTQPASASARERMQARRCTRVTTPPATRLAPR